MYHGIFSPMGSAPTEEPEYQPENQKESENLKNKKWKEE